MSREKRKQPELLLPAGSLEVLKTAFDYGADAVYIGGEAFGLRANAKNFSPEEMAEGLRFAHERGKRVYVTANILAHNNDLNEAERYFQELAALKPDAIIVSDPALFMLAKRLCPGIELHVSTQANNTNYGTFLFWRELGASRVVTARELSLAEIREIRERIHAEMEIATFVHVASCRTDYDVYFVLRPLSALELHGGAGRKPRRVHAPLPLAVQRDRGETPGRVHAGL